MTVVRHEKVFKARGLQEAARKIEALARAGGEANVSGMRVIGEEIMTDVKAVRPGAGVPVYTGPDHVGGSLRESGAVHGPFATGAVYLTFGGTAAPYALRQHEELDWRHKLGEARYLVRGLERWEAGHGPMEALEIVAEFAINAARRA